MLDKLKGGDVRSIGRSSEIVAEIEEDLLLIEGVFPGLHDHDPVLKARAADVLEKATREKPDLLLDHKRELKITINQWIIASKRRSKNEKLRKMQI